MIDKIRKNIRETARLIKYGKIYNLKRRPFESNSSYRNRLFSALSSSPNHNRRQKPWMNALKNLAGCLFVIAVTVIVCLAFVKGIYKEAANAEIRKTENLSRIAEAQEMKGRYNYADR